MSETISTLNETTRTVNTILVDANADIQTIAATTTGAIDEVRRTLADTRQIVGSVKDGRAPSASC